MFSEKLTKMERKVNKNNIMTRYKIYKDIYIYIYIYIYM